MSAKGGFDLPRRLDQSTEGARDAYHKMWKRPWPYDDEYLRKLARDITPRMPNKCALLLNAMRECHEFEAIP